MATSTAPQTDSNGLELGSEGWEEFLELETKVHRVAEALQQARSERDRAVAELTALRSAQDKLQQGRAQQEHELVALRKERQEIRQRLARLSKHLEAAES